MAPVTVLLMYLLMLTFDLALFAGTAYLIVYHSWSSWWMLPAFFVAGSSSPKYILEVLKKK